MLTVARCDILLVGNMTIVTLIVSVVLIVVRRLGVGWLLRTCSGNSSLLSFGKNLVRMLPVRTWMLCWTELTKVSSVSVLTVFTGRPVVTMIVLRRGTCLCLIRLIS